jgi:D-amino-acid oxidase
MDRRAFVQRSSLFALQLLGVSGCSTATMKRVRSPSNATAPNLGTVLPFYDAPGPIVPIRADLDRIFRITVCLRPFRSAGPRQDVERVGDKIIVHNYGHGGSGWSLSWGSADVVIRRALEASPGLNECAVVGCGALGLTAALTSQRMGIRTTIYAKERPPYVRSSRATGSWTPDSRVALASGVAPDFGAAWEKMARISFGMYWSDPQN